MRLSVLISLIGFASSAFGLVACSADTTADESNGSEEAATDDGAAQELKARVIGEKDNGKTVQITSGESFAIALSENASTGYQWKVTSVNRSLGYPKESMTPGNPGMIGSAGMKKFTWKTNGPFPLEGKHRIGLEYRRPFETTGAAAKTFEVTVDIAKVPDAIALCGGHMGLGCKAEEFCDYKIAHMCGAADHTGTCKSKPQICAEIYSPVCGCDNKTYSNACDANGAGVSVFKAGDCAAAK